MNRPSRHDKDQPGSQMQEFLLDVAAGTPIKTSAEKAGIALRTAHRRLQLPVVQEQLSSLRKSLFEDLKDKLLAPADHILSRLLEHVDSTDPRISLKACSVWLSLVVPRKFEIEAAMKEPEVVDEDRELREVFGRFESGGVLSAEQLAAFQSYKTSIEAAEASDDWNLVPSDYKPGKDERARLLDWRAKNHPEIASARFRLLMILKSMLTAANAKPGTKGLFGGQP